MAKKKLKTKVHVEKKNVSSSTQLGIILGTMMAVILILLVVPWIAKSKNTFEYQNMTFTKEKFGELDVYHYYYYYTNRNASLIKYNLFLRLDPRENVIPIQGSIKYDKNKFVYLSVNASGLTECPLASMSIASLTRFLVDNDLEVRGATNDKELADSTDTRFADCSSNPDNVVILIQRGEESKIYKPSPSCHIIQASKCEDVLPAVEKFMVQSVAEAKARG